MTTKNAPDSTFKYRRGRDLLLCCFLGIVHRIYAADIPYFRVFIGLCAAHPAGAVYLTLTKHTLKLVMPVIVLFVDNALLSADVVYSLISCVGSASAHAISPFHKTPVVCPAFTIVYHTAVCFSSPTFPYSAPQFHQALRLVPQSHPR